MVPPKCFTLASSSPVQALIHQLSGLVSLIPTQAILKTVKMGPIAFLLGTQHLGLGFPVIVSLKGCDICPPHLTHHPLREWQVAAGACLGTNG